MEFLGKTRPLRSPDKETGSDSYEDPYEKIAKDLRGQGIFFERLAGEKGVPREWMQLEESEKRLPKSIVTAKGSVYTYLSDGRTQRFKAAAGETNEPQDILVFIPPWDLIAEKAKKIYPEHLGGVENETIFQDILLEFAQLEGKTIRIIDESGSLLTTNEAVQKAQQVYMALIDKKDSKNSFNIPIGKRAVLGWNTLDTRRYTTPDGHSMHERHMGNKITQINY